MRKRSELAVPRRENLSGNGSDGFSAQIADQIRAKRSELPPSWCASVLSHKEPSQGVSDEAAPDGTRAPQAPLHLQQLDPSSAEAAGGRCKERRQRP